jgi:hypothetical protein
MHARPHEDKNKIPVVFTNYEDRGYSGYPEEEDWQRENYQKKVVMFPFTVDKLHLYLEKIDGYMSSVYNQVVINHRPLMGTLSEELQTFFFRLFLGDDDEAVGQNDGRRQLDEYLRTFEEYLGIGNPLVNCQDERLMYGIENYPRAAEYIKERIASIRKSGDRSTIIYWWALAGMSDDAIVAETIFSRTACTLYLGQFYATVVSKLFPVINPALPVQFVDFFKKYNEATTPSEKVNVIRESYRIFVPFSNSTSKLVLAIDPSEDLLSRHIHQAIMISNTPGGVAGYFTFDVSRYTGYNDVNIENGFLETLSPITNVGLSVYVSPKDQETVSDVVSPGLPLPGYQPVFDRPVYMSFGLGYRACVAQTLSLKMQGAFLDKFYGVEWEYLVGNTAYPLIVTGPAKRVYDNIFAKTTL